MGYSELIDALKRIAKPNPIAVVCGKGIAIDAMWDESKHPRKGGKFAKKGEGETFSKGDAVAVHEALAKSNFRELQAKKNALNWNTPISEPQKAKRQTDALLNISKIVKPGASIENSGIRAIEPKPGETAMSGGAIMDPERRTIIEVFTNIAKEAERREQERDALPDGVEGYDLVDHLDKTRPGWIDEILDGKIQKVTKPAFKHPTNPDLDTEAETEEVDASSHFDADHVREGIGEGYVAKHWARGVKPQTFGALKSQILGYLGSQLNQG